MPCCSCPPGTCLGPSSPRQVQRSNYETGFAFTGAFLYPLADLTSAANEGENGPKDEFFRVSGSKAELCTLTCAGCIFASYCPIIRYGYALPVTTKWYQRRVPVGTGCWYHFTVTAYKNLFRHMLSCPADLRRHP